MKRSAASSKDTASSVDTASSKAPSDDFDLERDSPTTEEDIRVQRELYRQPGENLLPRIDEIFSSQQLENLPPRRATSEGWEPFELE